ncbi:hypothetical protein BBJ29_000224 [Phytophthora kernoviae]|uniref:Uncharacterized protein n=1 Tax=Phytophthora kernoviae TaxID=325452 RepID=A0A3F2S341_9STRA|nr:hypothetical protein BBP00_00000410 [Phytophthora kernoviae]RLN70708.1 hypothetical protein BBJ29_000224 [Phytophthora kernoviae]
MASKELSLSVPATSATEALEAATSGRVRADDEPEPLVKKRRTKNFKLREDIAKSKRTTIVNLPPFEPRTFDTWDEFIQAWTEYMGRTKTLYRRRSSSTTTYWNTKHKFKKYQVPENFPYATMAYWCTHGCIQPSRGNGVRTHLHNRYTGCSARITADVVFEPVEGEPGKVRWFVRVRNQIAQHNHKVSDEIYNCYSNSNSVPDELLLGQQENSEQQRAETEEPDFEPSVRVLRELVPHVGVDGGTEVDIVIRTVPGLMLKEVLANEQKINMATSELQPIIDELRNTSSRVIHKRLQDVSEIVAHLLGKWHQDRVAEEAAQIHAIGPVLEHAAPASAEVLSSKATTNAISTITGLPAGSPFFLAQRVEQLTTEASRVAPSSGNNSNTSSDEDTLARSDRDLSGKGDQELKQQRSHSEAV